MSYRVNSRHPEDDAEGHVFAPGEYIEELDTSDPFNQRKIDAGIFVQDEIPESSAETLVPQPVIPDSTDTARKLAEKSGIDLAEVKGTGKDGRIVESDVEAAIEDKDKEDGNASSGS